MTVSFRPSGIQRLMPHSTVRKILCQMNVALDTSEDGYIVGVLPIALLLQRVPLVKALSVFIFAWGLICLLTIVVTGYVGLVVQRIFLGIVEVCFRPGLNQSDLELLVLCISGIRSDHCALVYEGRTSVFFTSYIHRYD